MPIRNHGSFGRMTGFCKTVIPKDLKATLLKLKDNTDELYEFGMDYLHKMCTEVLSAKDKDGNFLVPGLHFYTMNTEKCTIEIVAKCKIGCEDKGFEAHLNNELKRVLNEAKLKKEEKKRKEEEKTKAVTKAAPIQQGEFKEVNSF
eukprot:UN02998